MGGLRNRIVRKERQDESGYLYESNLIRGHVETII